MTDSSSSKPPDALDDFVSKLLECGGVLSQIIASMVQFQAGGRSAPDAAPIPEVAHTLIRSVLDGVGHGYSKRDIKVASRMVRDATEAICNELYVLGPELN